MLFAIDVVFHYFPVVSRYRLHHAPEDDTLRQSSPSAWRRCASHLHCAKRCVTVLVAWLALLVPARQA